MSRFVVAFCLLFLILCSVGCRLCSTPYDTRIATFIERPFDYRGFNPMYRAGSISDGWGGTHHVVRGTFHEDEFVDIFSNAGHFGITTPISTLRHTPDSGRGTPGMGTLETRPSFEPQPGTDRPIAIPHQPPAEEGFFFEPRVREHDGRVPTIDELLDRQRGTMPLPIPITPPGRQDMAPQGFGGMPTIPFSPSDEVIAPPNGFPPIMDIPIMETDAPNGTPTRMETDPPITLEELRRLDPTIQDVQIISIEDVTPGTRIR